MREFNCRPFRDFIVDLDDDSTYKYLPQTYNELDSLMFKEIGYALCYMDYFNKDIFITESGNDQRKRVEKLIKDFTDNRSNNYNNILWIREQVFLFQDEIENMC
jgi:hypothetical protein